MNVLIVDDEPDIAETLAVLMAEKKNFKVYSANNGEQAMYMIVTNEIDFIVSDLMMPTASGFDLLEALRANNMDIPVLFVSGHRSAEVCEQALEQGAIGVLDKPIDTDSVIATIEVCAELKKQAQPNKLAPPAAQKVVAKVKDAELRKTFAKYLSAA